RLFDREVDFAAESAGRVNHFPSPHAQLEIERAVTETFKIDAWNGGFQDVSIIRGNGEQDAFNFFGIGAVRDADGDANPDRRIAMAPVGQGAGDKVGVRHNDGDVVV